MPWPSIRSDSPDLGDCTRCKLHALGRRQIVFGVGNPDADLMFVGEAPGADEDVQGEPFVGRAGQLLTKIIEAIGLPREDVYIANVIKCRPPGNRNPEPDEVEQCEPFLFRQIDTIRPKVIVALGKFAAQSLLRTTEPITRLRGREFTYRDAILMPDLSPRVPAAHAVGQARRVGGHEESARHPGRRRNLALRLISVAVPVPFLDSSPTASPTGWPLPPSVRASASRVGSRTLTGCVVAHVALAGIGAEVRRTSLRRARRRARSCRRRSSSLARWVADYYAAGVGDALAVAMPPGARARANVGLQDARRQSP